MQTSLDLHMTIVHIGHIGLLAMHNIQQDHMHHLHSHTIMWKVKIPIILTMSIFFPQSYYPIELMPTFQGH